MCVRSVDIDLICPSPIFYFHVPGNPIIGVVPIISPPPITRYGSFSSEPLIGWLDDLICRLSRHFSLISPLFFLFLPRSLFFCSLSALSLRSSFWLHRTSIQSKCQIYRSLASLPISIFLFRSRIHSLDSHLERNIHAAPANN